MLNNSKSVDASERCIESANKFGYDPFVFKAITPEERDLGCITLLTLASEKSKKDGEMVKYEKLKKLQKNYLGKYEDNHFYDEDTKSQIEAHSLKIKEKGQRYINKGLQKCGLK